MVSKLAHWMQTSLQESVMVGTTHIQDEPSCSRGQESLGRPSRRGHGLGQVAVSARWSLGNGLAGAAVRSLALGPTDLHHATTVEETYGAGRIRRKINLLQGKGQVISNRTERRPTLAIDRFCIVRDCCHRAYIDVPVALRYSQEQHKHTAVEQVQKLYARPWRKTWIRRTFSAYCASFFLSKHCMAAVRAAISSTVVPSGQAN